MVLTEIHELASGFEGCEKKVEIDFHLCDPQRDLRAIPRALIDAFCTLARCTVISTRNNAHFDSYLLSESSLFIFPTKIILKTCGTTMLLKSVGPILDAAKSVGARPDFLQFSRSNFMFPQKQHFPHRHFSEETDYLNKLLGKEGDAFILGTLQGPRWHLYIVDFNEVDASNYKQQTCELIMFNLDPKIMKQFYQQAEAIKAGEGASSSSSSTSPSHGGCASCGSPTPAASMEECKEEKLVNSSGQGFANLNGEGSRSGDDATKRSGIDLLLPYSQIDAFLFNPCGYSCNGLLKDTYFTIHITPEPECSFVSFETNLNVRCFNALVKQVTETFRPGSFCLSLFVDEASLISDSRKGLEWNAVAGYTTKSVTHQAFKEGYNATCGHYELIAPAAGSAAFGSAAAALAASTKKAADSFDERAAIATQKLKDELEFVVAKAKNSEALLNKTAAEKAELEHALQAKADKERELEERIARLEAMVAGSSSSNGATVEVADASLENDKKRRKTQQA